VRVDFASGADSCAASHHAGTNGACIVMAGGLGLTRAPGTAPFASRFHAEGFSVLAFDYRRFGDSTGTPRQVVRIREQLEDWDHAIEAARRLPEVDDRIALWGFSLSGGHVIRAATGRHDVTAAIAQAPTADGMVAARHAMRHNTPGALLRLTTRAVLDALGGAFGAAPSLVPVAGEPGAVALLTTPDATDGRPALRTDGPGGDGGPRVAARFALSSGGYRPGRHARDVHCPLLVLAYDDDRSALPGPAVRAAARAPRGELARRPGGHYAGFTSDLDGTFRIELEFLQRHVLTSPAR
jgi:hypothetical protein